MKIYEPNEIRSFFAKRPWLRPKDYAAVMSGDLAEDRTRDLSIFMCGYFCARPASGMSCEPSETANTIEISC